MKIYVAGIRVSVEHIEKTIEEKTTLIIDLLKTIHDEAHRTLGADAIIMVLMPEYALTPTAISDIEKKNSLKMLHTAMQSFNNMILIPGSYASQEKFHSDERKCIKIAKYLANYSKCKQDALELMKSQTIDTQDICEIKARIQNFEEIVFNTRILEEMIFLQNSTYILTSDSKIKRKKCVPSDELRKLSFPPDDDYEPDDGIFYFGQNDPHKKIVIQNRQLDIGLFICLEHQTLPSSYPALLKESPLFYLIISDGMSFIDSVLTGALNVIMDRGRGLKIKINTAHCRAHEIDEVRGFAYTTNQPNGASKMIEPIYFSQQKTRGKSNCQMYDRAAYYQFSLKDCWIPGAMNWFEKPATNPEQDMEKICDEPLSDELSPKQHGFK